jgi:hypothetical protein
MEEEEGEDKNSGADDEEFVAILIVIKNKIR